MMNKTQDILNEVKKIILGKDDIIAKVFMCILANGHVLLEDIPGVGKTTLALSFSKVLGLDYKRVQFTSDSVPSDIIGFSMYNKETGGFDYVPGSVMTNLLLADEINRTSSKTQSALLEVMGEGNVTVDGTTYPVPKPFNVIATQNPVGSAGTQMLPHAQLDRFMVRLHMGYPAFSEQVNILRDRHTINPLDNARQVTTVDELLDMQRQIVAVFISDYIYEYVTELAQATREHPMVTLGLSPRGALAVCSMAKAYAYTAGRDYVVPEDVFAIFGDVCGHRIVLSPKAKMSEMTSADVIEEVLKEVKMPVEATQSAAK
ncbi:MAG: AAA family ATPase [Christensenellales bacterium]|jgi:MoxR-like ATPase